MGFHKTGTASLAKALLILGYRVCGHLKETGDLNPSQQSRTDLLEMTKPLTETYDAFADTPWFIFYRELLDYYPDARFILTTRTAESWYRSVVKHFGGYEKWNFHSWIYNGFGDPIGNRDRYIEIYNQHNAEVRKFYTGKNVEFLEMNPSENFDWNTLCTFLKCKKPLGKFPRVDYELTSKRVRRKAIYIAKKIYYKNI
ncbi:MAG: sulfotransferase family protein [Balneolaceae bacterium]